MLRQTPPFVSCDPDILGGVPCFAGTRVPIDIIIASLEAGMSGKQLRDWVPGITQAHLDAARAWLVEHPTALKKRND